MTHSNVDQALEAFKTQTHNGLFSPVVPGVSRLAVVFVNLYAVELANGSWVLVDTGLPNFAWYVRKAVATRYGAHARPSAIVLTHGHFDHAGNARELAEDWNIPIYAHELELPYLTKRSDYPPGDPTPGGAISFLSRFFPSHGVDLGRNLTALPMDGSIPPMPGWRWIHTPGHTAGHVSLVREEDWTVIVGDAVVSVDLDAWSAQITWPRELSRPPAPLTPDWQAARTSIERLAEQNPSTIATGHGLPITAPDLGEVLHQFAHDFEVPPGSQYEREPAKYAADGSVTSVPPPVPDPLPKQLAVGAAAALVGLGLLKSLRPHEDRG